MIPWANIVALIWDPPELRERDNLFVKLMKVIAGLYVAVIRLGFFAGMLAFFLVWVLLAYEVL